MRALFERMAHIISMRFPCSIHAGERIMFRLVLVLAIACGCGAALAQKKMYRCGNQFQERPCEGPKLDAAASSTAKSDPQQLTVAKRQEREQAIHQAKCENYAEELGDINKRIKAGANEKVMDQFLRRQKEMNLRIERECK
jgi:hypothetical protein